MRFTVPDDYTYQPLDNTAQGITGFTAEKDSVKTTLFRFSTDQRIDRSSCLSQRDDQWLPSLAKLPLISQSTPLWKRYDKVSDYRTDKGYLRVYRYVDRKGLGFLIAESPQPEWEAAERIASGQRYEITAGYLLDRGWYLLSKLLGYLVLALAALYVFYALRENARNTRMWIIPAAHRDCRGPADLVRAVLRPEAVDDHHGHRARRLRLLVRRSGFGLLGRRRRRRRRLRRHGNHNPLRRIKKESGHLSGIRILPFSAAGDYPR